MRTLLATLLLLFGALPLSPVPWMAPAPVAANPRAGLDDEVDDDDDDEDTATDAEDDDDDTWPRFEPATRRFSPGTAYTLPAGRFETGVFGPLRYGLTDDLELSAHPLWFFVWPGVTAKKQWMHHGAWTIATSHSLEVPTPFLRLIQVDGTGGIIPTDNTIPWFLQTEQRMIVTAEWAPGHDVTWYMGFIAAAHAGGMRMDTIDYPLAYPRLSALYNGLSLRAGLDLDGRLRGDFYYSVDFDLFVLPEDETRFAFEHSAGVSYRFGRRWSVFVGYKYAWSQLPFGSERVFLPLVDVTWGF
ncbi:hypothetical protein KJ612_08530 [Myxococcota bacterium]|nr:hypothetical protein [Myxococcota bacterium]